MNRKTLTALRGSIKKWKAIANGTGFDRGAQNCPLCNLFNTEDSEAPCDGCPVAIASHDDGCMNTPYEVWAGLDEADVSRTWDRQHNWLGRQAVSAFGKSAALAEQQFLESLLPVQP